MVNGENAVNENDPRGSTFSVSLLIQGIQQCNSAEQNDVYSHEYRGEVSIFAVNSSTPDSVMSKVCSNCAVAFPSLVAAVQPSGQVT